MDTLHRVEVCHLPGYEFTGQGIMYDGFDRQSTVKEQDEATSTHTTISEPL